MDLKKFNGYKTYLVAAAMLVYALIGLALGWVPAEAGMGLVFQALAIAGLRHGVEKLK